MSEKTYFERLNEGLIYPQISVEVDQYLKETNWQMKDIWNHHPIPRVYEKTFLNEEGEFFMYIHIFRKREENKSDDYDVKLKYLKEHIITIHTKHFSSEKEVLLPKNKKDFCIVMHNLIYDHIYKKHGIDIDKGGLDD